MTRNRAAAWLRRTGGVDDFERSVAHAGQPAVFQSKYSSAAILGPQCGRMRGEPHIRSFSTSFRMRDFDSQSLSHDAVHGYIAFMSQAVSPGEVTEREIIDNPWVQRLRQIHQLQTAWWVFPSAEHRRFQHVLGAMCLASRAAQRLYESLKEVCQDAPSPGYVESLLRMAALLHDVGHGPFGHFFDDHFLADFGLTHETLGSHIIQQELGETLSRVRRNPYSRLDDGEQLDPQQIAYLITRPKDRSEDDGPRWLRFLRSLFSGIYTVDNMDFVLRDAYMSGYSAEAFDLDRLLHYSFFSEQGLTIHNRGLPALVRFISVRAELFRSIYFHRTVRGIDLSLADLFSASKPYLFPGSPLDHLDEYLRFTDMSLLVDVVRWRRQRRPRPTRTRPAMEQALKPRTPLAHGLRADVVLCAPRRGTGQHLQQLHFCRKRITRNVAAFAAQRAVALGYCPARTPARHAGAAAGQNFLYDPARDQIRELSDSELIRRLPLSYRICRVYTEDSEHNAELAAALDSLISGEGEDALTNM